MNLLLGKGFDGSLGAQRWGLGILNIALISLLGCGLIGVEPDEIDVLDGETGSLSATGGENSSTESGGETDSAATTDPGGDGDGDPATGDGDSDPDTGTATDTTGDPTGDGDGDPGTSSGGDGDGDPDTSTGGDPLDIICTDLATSVAECTEETFDSAYADCITGLEEADGIGPACFDARVALMICAADLACDPNLGDCMAEIVAEMDACPL